jgi:ABC-type transport system substrate-binding protein
MDTWADLDALCDDQGLVRLTDDALALLTPVTTTNANWGETEADLPNYLVYNQTYPEFDFANVGLYKTGDHQITLVLGKALSGFTLLYNLSGNWLVKTDLYDACLKESDGVWTSTYNTSVETTCSYGPYKMSSYQTDKGMHFVKNDKWYGYTDGKHIYQDPQNGKVYPMYQTTEIDCQVVSEAATAKLMFLKGELMSYGLQTEDYATYRNSEFCHFTPGQATFFLLLNGHKEAIATREAADDFDQATQDLETITLTSFHRAMGLCFDKALYCDTLRPAQSPGFGLISDAYIYDAETGSTYRGSDQAKQVLCDVYGVDASKFANLDDAVASITGFDPVAAKDWFQKAYDEAIAAGFITDADGDGKSDQAITLTYSASNVSDNLTKMLDYLTEKCNEVTVGTPFENKISFVASAPLGNAWADELMAGLQDTCLAGWNGSALNPFSLSDLYCNPSRAFDGQWFDGNNVKATFNIGGSDITMTLKQWSDALNGSVVEVDGVEYNFGEGFADADTRLTILANIEREILLTYNYLPFSVDGSMALLSQKAYYVVEDYNAVLGRGGIAYLRYNYNDTEWADYVAECGGELTY